TSYGKLLKYDGKTWTVQSHPYKGFLYRLWGSDARHVWVVGAEGIIEKYDGSSWHSQVSGIRRRLFLGIWGSDARHVWTVGASYDSGGWEGEIYKYDGRTWSPQRISAVSRLNSVWGSDSRHIWAVGYDGVILFYDGVSWSPQTSGTDVSLY